MSAEHHAERSGENVGLDETIRSLFEHDGRTVAGWALVIATNRIDGDAPAGADPLKFGGGYSVGPGTHPATALGLAEGLAAHLRRVVEREVVDEE